MAIQTAFRVPLLIGGSATSASNTWPGGKGLFSVDATFGGGSVALEYQIVPGTAWIPASVVSTAGVYTAAPLLANGGFVFELPRCNIRAAISGTVTAANVAATAIANYA